MCVCVCHRKKEKTASQRLAEAKLLLDIASAKDGRAVCLLQTRLPPLSNIYIFLKVEYSQTIFFLERLPKPMHTLSHAHTRTRDR